MTEQIKTELVDSATKPPRARVDDHGRHLLGVGGLNLEVFCGVAVGHLDALLDVVHHHNRGLAACQ